MYSLELFCVMCWGRGNEIKKNRDSVLWLCQRVDNEHLENSLWERMTKCHSKFAHLYHKNLLLLLEMDGSKLETCQSFSIILLIFCRWRNSHLWSKTHKLLSIFFFFHMVKRKARKRILWLHQTSMVYRLEMYDLSFMSCYTAV